MREKVGDLGHEIGDLEVGSSLDQRSLSTRAILPELCEVKHMYWHGLEGNRCAETSR